MNVPRDAHVNTFYGFVDRKVMQFLAPYQVDRYPFAAEILNRPSTIRVRRRISQ
jgi:hypothetical protein